MFGVAPSRSFVAVIFSGVGLALLATSISISSTKGIWADELWSVYVARHDLGLWQALTTRWLPDNHPPTFYLFAWLFEPVVGDGIQARRALNIVPLVLALATGAIVAWRRPELRAFCAIFALLIVATNESIANIAEHRSNFFQLCAASALVVVWAAIVRARGDYTRSDRWLWALLTATILIAFNLHFFATLICGVLAAAMVVATWISGRRRWAVRIVLSGVVGIIPLITMLIWQSAQLTTAAQSFWVQTTTPEAAMIIARTLRYAIGANLVVLLVALNRARLFAQAKTVPRETSVYVATLVVALVVAVAGLLMLNTLRPMIVARYVIALVPMAVAVVAMLAADDVMRSRVMLVLVVVNIGVQLFTVSRRHVDKPNWNAAAEVVANIVARCPATVVHARAPWVIRPEGWSTMANQAEIFRFGYEMVARVNGFAIAPVQSRAVSATCPTIVWSEHGGPTAPPLAEIARRAGLVVSGAGGRVVQTLSGFVAVFLPAP